MIVAQSFSEPILVLPLHWLYHLEVQKIEKKKCICIICNVKYGILIIHVNFGLFILSEPSLRHNLHEI